MSGCTGLLRLDIAGADHLTPILDFVCDHPKDAYSYVSRARSFGAKGDRDRATADFSKAIEINPKYYYAYILRGDALEAKGEHDRAIGDFTKAIEIEPKNTAAYRSRASAYLLAGARSLAIADYKTILELPAVTDADRQWQGYARQRIAQLTSTRLRLRARQRMRRGDG